jgi:hypothetical protein
MATAAVVYQEIDEILGSIDIDAIPSALPFSP